MRQIKFRGKSIDTGEWLYGDLARIWSYGVENTYVLEGANIISVNDLSGYDVNPETIGQFTGLKDKNGKAIYAGDVWKEPEDCPRIVKWHDDNACFFLEPTESNHDTSDFYQTHCLNGEVTGTIHDTPTKPTNR